MSIWKHQPSLEQLNNPPRHTAAQQLGIEITEVGPDYIKGRMPVDGRTHQPFGLLHGGASVLLAETLGSLGSWMCVDPQHTACVGLEINANHVRGVRHGWVEGCARPLHIGRTTQVWEIRITDEKDRLVCVSRLTVAVIPQHSHTPQATAPGDTE